MQIGGIVLAGGRSRRMGVAKANLPFGPETLLARVVRIVGEAVSPPVIVVAAQEQELPSLPGETIIVRDQHPERGPLEGLAAGLDTVKHFDAVYVSACDTPLISSAFIRQILQRLDNAHDAAVPFVDGRAQPLAGVYRTSVLPAVKTLLANGQLRMLDLLDQIRVRQIQPAELRSVDPDLLSLKNLNSPSDYESALAAAGLSSDNRTR